MQDSRRASSSALAHAALPASGLGANLCHGWSDAPLIATWFLICRSAVPHGSVSCESCGFGLVLGISRCHERALHVLQHRRERRHLALLPKDVEHARLSLPSVSVTGRIGWDACPQNEALTAHDVRAPKLGTDGGAVVRLGAASATM
jgi:hypothetical protein